jgi:hypothetical protein
MPEPAICSLLFISFKNRVARKTMMKMAVELRSNNIIKSTHIPGISGVVAFVIIFVYVA